MSRLEGLTMSNRGWSMDVFLSWGCASGESIVGVGASLARIFPAGLGGAGATDLPSPSC
jgi:hypothetical protein